jgi:hypothetical protein
MLCGVFLPVASRTITLCAWESLVKMEGLQYCVLVGDKARVGASSRADGASICPRWQDSSQCSVSAALVGSDPHKPANLTFSANDTSGETVPYGTELTSAPGTDKVARCDLRCL